MELPLNTSMKELPLSMSLPLNLRVVTGSSNNRILCVNRIRSNNRQTRDFS
jgi:hypothetical protein